MFAGLSLIDPLQQRPMLAVMRRQVCPNNALPSRGCGEGVEASARLGCE